VAAAFVLRGGKDDLKFRTATVDKGNITQRISASGTINPLIQVPVGTQVSGVVTSLTADFNSLVRKGQVVGTIDKTPWETSLRDAEAQEKGAEVSLAYAKVTYARDKKLWEAKILGDSDLDVAETSYKTAAANVASLKAKVDQAKTNLNYCTLRAPVDGVVVARLVDVGQTVAASFSTPNIFTIAQDLSKMKVQAAIDEADIGQVRVGQHAFFTVDSYPEKQFRGLVSEVQLNPVITSNVVTFNVIMEVDNEPRVTYAPELETGRPHSGSGPAPAAPPQGGRSGRMAVPPGTGARGEAFHGALRLFGKLSADQGGGAAGESQVASIETSTARYIPKGSLVYKCNLALFPGMTANCTIVTDRRQDVLRVPATALRFNPNAYLKDSDRKPGRGVQAQHLAPSVVVAKGLVSKRDDHVWVMENGKPKAVQVKIGISDGQYTEITGDGVREGMVVLTGIDDSGRKALATQAASPLGAHPMGPGGGRH
jgi:HlyD family secretion protein